MSNARILYFAIADGRGHLMRAQLLHRVLAPRGISVEIVTTSAEGAAFLEQFGLSARVLPNSFELQFDSFHRLDEKATRRRLLQTLSPARASRQLALLEKWAAGADLVVNDSLYPLLMIAAAWRKRMRVVQVVGENIHLTAHHRVQQERVPALRFAGEVLFRRSFERAFGRIFHTLGATRLQPASRTFHLSPLVAGPSSSAQCVRDRLGVGERKLAAVYLNPHYRDPRVAEAIERAARASGFALHGVSEAFGSRPGWRPWDAHFVDVANAADVLVSGAGMAALEQARALSLPLIALLGRQPEQEANVMERTTAQVLRADAVSLEQELGAALSALPRRVAGADGSALLLQQQWGSVFESLIHAARTEAAHGTGVTGDRNGEPQGRWGGAR